MDRDLEIVGLSSPDNGRSCCLHDVCGAQVKEGDLLRLTKTVIFRNGIPEEAIKAVVIVDGADACTVGFVRHGHIYAPNVVSCLTSSGFVVVLELYKASSNRIKQEQDTVHHGMAACIMIKNIEKSE